MNYMTRKTDLWNPLADFRREMDSLFDDFFSPTRQRTEGGVQTWSPACDLAVEDNHYLLTVEMPGIPKNDIKVEVVDHTVNISGERKFEEKKKENGAWYGERRYGKFQRSFTLPAGIDADKIEASYQDGVLHLMVPKAEYAKPRQIQISSSGPGFFGKLLGETRKKETEQPTEKKIEVA